MVLGGDEGQSAGAGLQIGRRDAHKISHIGTKFPHKSSSQIMRLWNWARATAEGRVTGPLHSIVCSGSGSSQWQWRTKVRSAGFDSAIDSLYDAARQIFHGDLFE